MGKIADALRAKYKSPKEALAALGLDEALLSKPAMDKQPATAPTKPISFAAFASDAFEEGKHSRDDRGRFGAGTGKSHRDHALFHAESAKKASGAEEKEAHEYASRLHSEAASGGPQSGRSKASSAYAASETAHNKGKKAIVDKAYKHFTGRHGVNIERGAVEAHLLGGDHPEHKTLMANLPEDHDGADPAHMRHAFGLEPHEVKKLAQDANWDESKHSRANNGQFGAGEGKGHYQHEMHHETMAQGLKSQTQITKGMSPNVKKMKLEAAALHESAAKEHNKAYGGHEHDRSDKAHAASEKAHAATSAAHEREMLESYGAGSGKSHEEHAQYHDEQVDRHLDVGGKQASNTYAGGDESRKHFEAAAANARAKKLHRDAKTDDQKTEALKASKDAHESSKAADAHTAEREKTDKRKDDLTKKHSAFKSFKEMAEAEGGYRPSIDVDHPEKKELADHYDAHQEARGDPRRAFRFGKGQDKVERDGRMWKVRKGTSSGKVRANTHAEAVERAAQIGFKDPDDVVLHEEEPPKK